MFSPGDLVLCIDDAFPADALRSFAKFGLNYPVAGKSYTVRNLDPEGGRRQAVYLAEIVNPAIELVRGSDRRRFARKEPPFAVRRFVKLCHKPDPLISTAVPRSAEGSRKQP